MRSYATKHKAHTGTDRYTTSDSHRLKPTDAQIASAHDNLNCRSRIATMNRHDRVPGAEANLNRLLSLKRDLCCVPGCPRKHIYWTPTGKYCGKHREEAIAAFAAAKKKRYGDA